MLVFDKVIWLPTPFKTHVMVKNNADFVAVLGSIMNICGSVDNNTLPKNIVMNSYSEGAFCFDFTSCLCPCPVIGVFPVCVQMFCV